MYCKSSPNKKRRTWLAVLRMLGEGCGSSTQTECAAGPARAASVNWSCTLKVPFSPSHQLGGVSQTSFMILVPLPHVAITGHPVSNHRVSCARGVERLRRWKAGTPSLCVIVPVPPSSCAHPVPIVVIDGQCGMGGWHDRCATPCQGELDHACEARVDVVEASSNVPILPAGEIDEALLRKGICGPLDSLEWRGAHNTFRGGAHRARTVRVLVNAAAEVQARDRRRIRCV
eukprot:1764528-Prymnesium_polylepis.1